MKVKIGFIKFTEVIANVTLDKGEYIVVPSTFEPDQEGKFELKLFSDNGPVPIEAIALKASTMVEGEWKGNTSGGCLNFPSWRSNPQFLVNVQQAGTVRIELEQPHRDPLHFIGFYVVNMDDHGRKILQVTKKNLATNTEFINLKKG